MLIEYHKPVLVQEVVRSLKASQALVMVDATLGDGGHSQALLEAKPDSGHVLALDMDAEAIGRAKIRLANFADSFKANQGNFGKI